MWHHSRRWSWAFGLVILGLFPGCGGDADVPSQDKKSRKPVVKKQPSSRNRVTQGARKKRTEIEPMGQAGKGKKKTSRPLTKQVAQPGRLDGGVGPKLDQNRIATAGIRKIEGPFLTVYTDLPAAADVDELPKVFAAAVPHWCRYFNVDSQRLKRWQPTVYIMKNKDRFSAIGALRADLPPFQHGFQVQNELWIYEQPSSYYRRHLLLHEGTHCFTERFLGGKGPPWYMEGIAEFLATHKWENGKLQMSFNPLRREQVPRWARVRLAKDAYKNGLGRSLDQIFNYGSRAHLRVEPYAWCWAAVTFFERHPKYQARFRKLKSLVARGQDLTDQLRSSLEPEWPHVVREWQLFVANMEYGYDIAKSAIIYKPIQPLVANRVTRLQVRADRGWQSTGIVVRKGQEVVVQASGRYQLVAGPKKWMSEPGGVTIRYYRGQPLGRLLAGVCDEGAIEPTTSLADPQPVGLKLTLKAPRDGTLFLKINDSAAELHDNSGHADVVIRGR